MNYPRYPEYKPSGVEWLGEVPAHWGLDRMKWSVTGCQNGIWGAEPDGADDIICVRVADFDRQRFSVVLDQPTVRAVTEKERKGRVLANGDLLIEKSGGGELQPVGAVVNYVRDEPAVCSNFVARMPVARHQDSRYWAYLHAHLYSGRVNVRSIKQTTGIQNLDSSMYLNEVAAYPPYQEQRAIAAFLDRETARIDALIAKKQRLIELLAEKRTALISQAVTKGLSPDAPMKDSGVEWLSEIPPHWEVRRLSKVVSKLTNGFVGPTRDILVESGVRYLQSLHIKDGKVDFSRGEYYVTEEWSRDHSKSILRVGDVLIVQTGDIGQTALVTEEFDGCNCHALIIARPYESVCTGTFLDFLFRSRYGRQVFNSMQTGALHPHLNCTIIRDMFIPLPPIDEQNAITKWVSTEIDRLVVLRTAVESAIDKLKEYRAALVADAVTGKIDVRSFVKEKEVA